MALVAASPASSIWRDPNIMSASANSITSMMGALPHITSTSSECSLIASPHSTMVSDGETKTEDGQEGEIQEALLSRFLALAERAETVYRRWLRNPMLA